MAAQILDVQLQPVDVGDPPDFAAAFDAVSRGQPDVLIVLPDSRTSSGLSHIVDFATKQRLPAMYPFKQFVTAGGLMSYGPSNREVWSRTSCSVDRILKGTKPADLLVEQPREFEGVVNRKTARALGLTIPYHVALQMTEAIE